jgi:peptidoglycan hydrolase-like protein with peptidoglycan-binding domain
MSFPEVVLDGTLVRPHSSSIDAARIMAINTRALEDFVWNNKQGVQALQNMLEMPSNQIDGIFGIQTREALRLFQRRYWLIPDGIIGTQTKNALILYKTSLE